ncbi:MAG: DUF4405 domain-containing protein [Thermogutta sp.]
MSSKNFGSNDQVKEQKIRRGFRFQAFTSLLVLCLLVLVVVSGVILYISPRGRVANWGQWTVWGWSKESWAALHINATICFLVFTMVHLVFNWKMLIGYLKRGTLGLFRGSFELLMAVVLGAVVVIGTMMNLPPFSQFVAWRESFKNYWERTSPPAAVPHLEEFAMAQIAELAGVEVNEIIDVVTSQGMDDVKSADTLAEIAKRSGKTPREIFEGLAEQFPELKSLQGNILGPRRGQGGMRSQSPHDQPGFGSGSGFGRGGGHGMGQGFRRGRMSEGDH